MLKPSLSGKIKSHKTRAQGREGRRRDENEKSTKQRPRHAETKCHVSRVCCENRTRPPGPLFFRLHTFAALYTYISLYTYTPAKTSASRGRERERERPPSTTCTCNRSLRDRLSLTAGLLHSLPPYPPPLSRMRPVLSFRFAWSEKDRPRIEETSSLRVFVEKGDRGVKGVRGRISKQVSKQASKQASERMRDRLDVWLTVKINVLLKGTLYWTGEGGEAGESGLCLPRREV